MKGLRTITVHATTNYGPLVTHHDSGFPIKGGWSQAKRGSGRPGRDSVGLSDEPTYSKSNCGSQGPLDEMFTGWLKHPLLPRLLGSSWCTGGCTRQPPPYYHGFDPEIKVPGSSTKLHNTQLLKKCTV